VGLDEALRTCRDILEGRLDDIPVEAFYFAGGIEEIRMWSGLVRAELSRGNRNSRPCAAPDRRFPLSVR
jgi:hypothetical protein